MPKVKVTVVVEANGKKVKRSEKNVSLTQDNLSISAGNLGYELAEDAWGLFPSED